MENNNRPKWDFAIPLQLFRKIDNMFVTKIEHKWKYTSADTSEAWLVFYPEKGNSLEIKDPNVWKYFKFRPDHWAKLIELTYEGERAKKVSDAIAAFDKKHNAELATYKRLKKKFEGAGPEIEETEN